MKKVLIVLILVFSLFSVSCNLISNGFNASMKDFFDENLGTARITDYKLLQTYYTGSDGYLNIPSDDNFLIELYLHNPQGYKFEVGKNLTIRMEDETVNNELNVTGEPDNLTPLYSIYSDQSDKTNSTLILYFSKSFLQNWEGNIESGGNISPIITLSHPLSDEIFESYGKLKLRSNSPPPSVSGIEIFKYFNGEDQYYCIDFNMPPSADLLGIHKDISKIEIKIESEGKTVNKTWNVEIKGDGTFSFEGEPKEGRFEYGGGYDNNKENPVTYFSDVNFSSNSEIVCHIALWDKWLKADASKKVEASDVKEYSIVLDPTDLPPKVELGKGQSITIEKDFELKEGSGPIKITIDESCKEGDVILVPGEGKELTEKDIKNFEIDSDEYEIELKDGKGVISKKPEQGAEEKPDPGSEEKPNPGTEEKPEPPVEENPNPPVEIKPSFEITLPVNEEYAFTITTTGRVFEGQVQCGGSISFDVKTKDGKYVQNGTFEISLIQNGDVFVSGVDKKIDIDEEMPLGNYDIYMSVEIDGIKLDKILPVEVVKNGGRA